MPSALYSCPFGTFRLESDGCALVSCLPYSGKGIEEERDRALSQAMAELDEYFGGKRRLFSLPLAIVATDFRKAVYDALARVPAGVTVTYGELAAEAGHEGACRAVGNAMAANRLLLFVPCHRVLSTSGLGGFSAGLDMKRKLLKFEKEVYCENRA